VVAGADMGTSPGRDSRLFEGPVSSDRSFFDFGRFLEVGGLDYVFKLGVPPDSKSTRTSDHVCLLPQVVEDETSQRPKSHIGCQHQGSSSF
jgi:hypothetical protein